MTALPPDITKPAPTIIVGAGPKNARTDPESGLRFYTWQGRELPSVTSVRRMAGIPHGLHQWSITQVINKALDNLPSIFARLASGAAADPGQVALIRTELRRGATEERDRSAQLGIAVHDAAATGRSLTAVPPEVAPRLRQHLDWLKQSGAEVLAVEFQVWNLEVGYAGTADLLVRFPDGSIWVVDLKTGKGVYAEHSLQLIAYLMGEFVGNDGVVDEARTALLHSVTGMAVLHLTNAGWEFQAIRADSRCWNAFRGLLAFATWMWAHEKAADVVVGRRKGAAGPEAPEPSPAVAVVPDLIAVPV